MLTIKRIVLILLLLFCMHVPALAANWVEVYSDDLRQVYVDTNSIGLHTSPKNDEYVVAWCTSGIIGDDTENRLPKALGKDADILMYFQAYNKDIKQEQTLFLYICDKVGEVRGHGSWPFQVEQYQEIKPGTFNEIRYDFIMKYYNEHKK